MVTNVWPQATNNMAFCERDLDASSKIEPKGISCLARIPLQNVSANSKVDAEDGARAFNNSLTSVEFDSVGYRQEGSILLPVKAGKDLTE